MAVAAGEPRPAVAAAVVAPVGRVGPRAVQLIVGASEAAVPVPGALVGVSALGRRDPADRFPVAAPVRRGVEEVAAVGVDGADRAQAVTQRTEAVAVRVSPMRTAARAPDVTPSKGTQRASVGPVWRAVGRAGRHPIRTRVLHTELATTTTRETRVSASRTTQRHIVCAGVTTRGAGIATIDDKPRTGPLPITPCIHTTRGQGVEVTRPHPNAVGQVAKVADGRGAQTLRAASPDGQGVPEPRLKGQEAVHDERPPPVLRVTPRPVALAMPATVVGPPLPLIGIARRRHAPQIILDVPIRHRLPRLLRRPELVVGGRPRDVEAVSNKVAVDAPRGAATDVAHRPLLPTKPRIAVGQQVANQAPGAGHTPIGPTDVTGPTSNETNEAASGAHRVGAKAHPLRPTLPKGPVGPLLDVATPTRHVGVGPQGSKGGPRVNA